MPSSVHPENRDRLRSAVAVGLLHALIGYLLLTGLGYGPPTSVPDALKLFNIDEEPPPPPAKPASPDIQKKTRKARPKNAEGAASPANLRNTPTQIVAPPPEIRLPVPPPIPAAPAAGQGSAMAAGAANVPGPGTGSGGIGNGLGAAASATARAAAAAAAEAPEPAGSAAASTPQIIRTGPTGRAAGAPSTCASRWHRAAVSATAR